ncbi:MAG: SIMPL domain-containing protein [Thioalkalispiraceae bacterium]|jgi:hypothetical protein
MSLTNNNWTIPGLLVASILLLVSCSDADDASEAGIEVTGVAQVSVVPDLARFSFSINERGKVLTALKQDIDRKTADLVVLCKQLGIASKHISSSEVSIRPQYNYQTKAFIGYEVSRHVKVTLQRLEKYPELVNGAIKSGITTIGSITLDINNRQQLERSALASAMETARQKAEILAKSSALRLGKVVNVKEAGGPVRLETFRFKEKAGGVSSVQGTFEPGEISVTASVLVRYAIK